MNSEHEHDSKWGTALDRELKGLPELPAPVTLAPRVMAALRERKTSPWYSQPWPMWPAAVRAVSLVLLLALFAGVCFAVWTFFPAGSVTTSLQDPGGWKSDISVVWTTLGTLAGAATQVGGKLGPGIVIAFLALVTIYYAACVGAGTMFVRFAFVRRRN